MKHAALLVVTQLAVGGALVSTYWPKLTVDWTSLALVFLGFGAASFATFAILPSRFRGNPDRSPITGLIFLGVLLLAGAVIHTIATNQMPRGIEKTNGGYKFSSRGQDLGAATEKDFQESQRYGARMLLLRPALTGSMLGLWPVSRRAEARRADEN